MLIMFVQLLLQEKWYIPTEFYSDRFKTVGIEKLYLRKKKKVLVVGIDITKN